MGLMDSRAPERPSTGLGVEIESMNKQEGVELIPVRQEGNKLLFSRDNAEASERIRENALMAFNLVSANPVNIIETDERGIVQSVTDELCKFTGYSKSEMLGRQCSFLQGEGTDIEDIKELRWAMDNNRQTTVVILNYCKDGRPFWNILTIKPLYSSSDVLDVNRRVVQYTGEVINLPVHPQGRRHPQLCLEDAISLIELFSSVPRALKFAYVNDRFFAVKDSENATQRRDRMGSIAQERDSLENLTQVSTHTRASVEGLNSVIKNRFDVERQRELEEVFESRSLVDIDEIALSERRFGVQKHQNYARKFLPNDAIKCKADNGEDAHVFVSKYVFVAETGLPTRQGRFRMRAYRNTESGAEPLAMIVGFVEGQSDVVVRIHDQCITSEVFGSLKCDCKEQLDYSLDYITQQKLGIVLYLPQEGRGIGLANKVAAYAAQEAGMDTVDANRHLGLPDDAREYDSVRDILADLNVRSIRLLSNNPRKFDCLQKLGVEVSKRIPCIVTPNSQFSMRYLYSKADRMGHMINVETMTERFRRTPSPMNSVGSDVSFEDSGHKTD